MGKPITGLSPRREQVLQERQMVRMAKRIEARVGRSIRKAMLDMAQSNGNPSESALAIRRHQDEMRQILRQEYEQVFKWFGGRILQSTKKQIEYPAEFLSAMEDWIALNGSIAVTQIAFTTQSQAMAIINEMVAQAAIEGLGEREAAKLLLSTIREKGGVLSRARAQVISRTEPHNAAGSATHIAATESNIPMMKRWVSTGGNRTREDHADVDPEPIPIDQPFIVGGEELMYAGDPNGSAANVCNCRCVVVYETV